MKTLYDFGQAILQIRDAANSMEVKGHQNAAYVVLINGRCNELIEAINEISKKTEKADGDVNERNTGVSG